MLIKVRAGIPIAGQNHIAVFVTNELQKLEKMIINPAMINLSEEKVLIAEKTGILIPGQDHLVVLARGEIQNPERMIINPGEINHLEKKVSRVVSTKGSLHQIVKPGAHSKIVNQAFQLNQNLNKTMV
jgi:hypothetical protein